MSLRCPAGHESTSTDYCDTCGIAMGDAPGAASGAPDDHDTGTMPVVEPTPDTSGACPSCGTGNPANALFCENCGYDFTTGALPRPVTTNPLDVVDAPAEVAVDAPSEPSDAAAGLPSDAPAASPPAASPTGPAPAAGNPSPAPPDPWVAEVWIDPDWYTEQQSSDPLPSPGLPAVVALRHSSILIGRASRSRGISPDLDLGTDPGISRRHAQLTTDGSRWFVEDLGSSNGTYVGGALGVLPTTPVTVGQKTEVRPDERVYLGAWTRIVIRRAAPGEVD